MYIRKLSDNEFDWQLTDYQELQNNLKTLKKIKFLGDIDMNKIGAAIDNIEEALFGRLKVLSTGIISWPNY